MRGLLHWVKMNHSLLFAQLGKQILRVDGLGEDFKFIPTHTRVFQQISRCRLTGEKQNFAARQESANVNCCLDAVHVRHNDVADNQVWFSSPGKIDGIIPGVGGGSIEARLVQNDGQCIGDDMLIIHYKYAGLCLVIRHVSSWMQEL